MDICLNLRGEEGFIKDKLEKQSSAEPAFVNSGGKPWQIRTFTKRKLTPIAIPIVSKLVSDYV